MATNRQSQISGRAPFSSKYVNETSTRQSQIAGGPYVNETVTAGGGTAIYSRSRVSNIVAAPGGAAQSRGRIVNSGIV